MFDAFSSLGLYIWPLTCVQVWHYFNGDLNESPNSFGIKITVN